MEESDPDPNSRRIHRHQDPLLKIRRRAVGSLL